MSAINPTKVIIPCRISYAHLFEPTSVNGSDPKYGASLIVSKKDAKTITAIQKAIEQAKKDSVGKWGGKVPPNLKIWPVGSSSPTGCWRRWRMKPSPRQHSTLRSSGRVSRATWGGGSPRWAGSVLPSNLQ